MLEVFSNNAQTTLDGGIDASVTSLDLQSGTLFPSTGNFRIRIDDEIMLVTARSGVTCTVERAVEGTTGAAHSHGAVVRHVLTAEGLEQAIYESRAWIEIVKTADEDISSNTTLQDDNELVTPALTAGSYEFEAVLITRNPVASGGNLKIAFGEDSTTRGSYIGVGTNTSGNAAVAATHAQFGATQAWITVSTETKTIWIRGTFVSSGAAFKLQWAQNASSGNVVRVYAGSYLRYRQVV